MKKKIIPFAISAVAAGLLLGGCNLFGNNGDTTQEATTAAAGTTQTSAENSGDVVEKDGVRKKVVYTDDSPGISDGTGSMRYSIDSVQLADVITTTDNASRLLDLEKNTDAVMVTIGFSCENTGTYDNNVYISQAEIETDAGDKATPKSLYGDYMDGHFGPDEAKKGSNVYIIKGTKSADIKSIKFHIDAPADSDFQDCGEPVDFVIKIDQ